PNQQPENLAPEPLGPQQKNSLERNEKIIWRRQNFLRLVISSPIEPIESATPILSPSEKKEKGMGIVGGLRCVSSKPVSIWK
ncbi:MAG TPA: hypothetical protein PLH79_19655, partial [bacterium]|nr:hypothetical protein [bacterium]